jgi:hypothetical protein
MFNKREKTMKNLFNQVNLLFVLILVLSACNTHTWPLPPAQDYIIFGDFHGESMGPKYSNIYKIEEGQIFKDTTHIYPMRDTYHSWKWVKLQNSMMDLVNDSINNIPSELIAEKSNVIGEPDSHDQGGYYLEIYQNKNFQNLLLFWWIDTDINNVPDYLKNYLRTLESVIDSLNNNSKNI